ncbi:MAG: 6-hydroxycyclohex-1-ene-1-carbonyl-CoA dehydrogenase [Chloroflexota bacterium]
MAEVPSKINTWHMVEPGDPKAEKPGKFEQTSVPVPELKPGQVLVKVAGCGVCHTDLGYFYDGVPTVQKPPLALGHEISGTVVAGDENWIGKEVIIPAVMPCRQCELCKIGRGNRCLNQSMPGNSMGIYGGHADYIPVPSVDLCEVKTRKTVDGNEIPLSHLSVVADAMTTPFQACKRAGVVPGDRVIVIGCTGGVGVHQTQMVKAFGASVVIGIARSEEKLKRSLDYGADFTISSADKSAKDIRNEFRNLCKENGFPDRYGWKIFEVTGTKAGQDMALQLLQFTSKLMVVGFGPSTNEYAISRLMAFDSEIVGTWGCLPEYYPIVLDMILKNKIALEPFVETRPMSQMPQILDEVHSAGSPSKRIVLTPDF